MDRITGAGEHLFEWTLNLGPGWKAGLEEGGRASLSHDGLGLELEVKSRERLEFDLVKGEAEPLAGWFSRDYGRISPGLALRFGLRASAAEVLIELRPASGAAPCFQELYQGLPAGLAGLFMLGQNKPSE